MRAFVWRVLLGVWVGALLCFGAVVAPALFRVLPRPDAGSVVREVIPTLDRYGMLAAVALVALTVGEQNDRKTWVRRALFIAMGACAALSFFAITPALEELRPQLTDATRPQFGRLHGISTALSAAVLLMGLVGLALPPRREP